MGGSFEPPHSLPSARLEPPPARRYNRVTAVTGSQTHCPGIQGVATPAREAVGLELPRRKPCRGALTATHWPVGEGSGGKPRGKARGGRDNALSAPTAPGGRPAGRIQEHRKATPSRKTDTSQSECGQPNAGLDQAAQNTHNENRERPRDRPSVGTLAILRTTRLKTARNLLRQGCLCTAVDMRKRM